MSRALFNAQSYVAGAWDTRGHFKLRGIGTPRESAEVYLVADSHIVQRIVGLLPTPIRVSVSRDTRKRGRSRLNITALSQEPFIVWVYLHLASSIDAQRVLKFRIAQPARNGQRLSPDVRAFREKIAADLDTPTKA